MPRRPREQSPYGYYHLTNRGPGKRSVFRDAQDRDFFLKCVKLAHRVCAFSLVSSCIMTTHFHLVINCEHLVPPALFQSIGARYSAYYHKKYGTRGQVFHGRFHCEVIKSEAHLLSAIRYVWRNPVKAHMCKTPDDYPWSSFALLGADNDLIDNRLLLTFMNEDEWRAFALWDNDERHLEPFSHRMTDAAIKKAVKDAFGDKGPGYFWQADRQKFRVALSRCVYDGVTIPQLARYVGKTATALYRSVRSWGKLQVGVSSIEACASP